MLETLQVLTTLLAAIVLTTALAHALELPGKMRLGEHEYRAIQTIYYPGFTVAGVAEPLSILASFILLFLTPDAAAFWLTLGAFLALLLTHLLYWVWTHPVNNFWLANFELKGFGAKFFRSDPFSRAESRDRPTAPDWTELRNRWEYSHVARAVLALLGLVLLVTAIAL